MTKHLDFKNNGRSKYSLSIKSSLQLSLILFTIILSFIAGTQQVFGKIIEYTVEYEMVDNVAISPDGLFIAAVVDDRNVYLFNAAGDRLWMKSYSSWVDSISISGDKHDVLIACGEELLLFDINGELKWRKTYSSIFNAAISGDGKYVVAVVSEVPNNRILVMDKSGNNLNSVSTEFGDAELSVSDDASFIVVQVASQVRLYTRECKQIWSKNIFSVSYISVSSSGSVAVVSYSMSVYNKDGNLIWGRDTGIDLRPRAAYIAQDGKYIAATINNEVALLDGEGKQLWSQKVAERLIPEDVDISADGSKVAVAARSFYSPGQGAIYILDNPPGTEVIKKPSVTPSKIVLNTDPSYTLIGKEVKIWGDISHPTSSLEIIIRYHKPDGDEVTRSTLTKSDGSFSDTIVGDQIGLWRVNASFTGSSDYKAANTTSTFLVEVVEQKTDTQNYQPGSKASMDAGERRSLESVKSGDLYYKYRIIDTPGFIDYYANYVEEIGGDDHIEATIKVMPWATPGTYKIKTEWGWSGSAIVAGEFKYTYQLDYEIEVKAPKTKYQTSISLLAEGKEGTFNTTGIAYININGYKGPLIGQSISIEYSKPDGSKQTRTVTTGNDGSFNDKVKTDIGGLWKAQALLKGTESLEPSSSEVAQFNAKTTTNPTSQIPIPSSSILVGLALSIALLVFLTRQLPTTKVFGFLRIVSKSERNFI
jgi:hypothetical protein